MKSAIIFIISLLQEGIFCYYTNQYIYNIHSSDCTFQDYNKIYASVYKISQIKDMVKCNMYSTITH